MMASDWPYTTIATATERGADPHEQEAAHHAGGPQVVGAVCDVDRFHPVTRNFTETAGAGPGPLQLEPALPSGSVPKSSAKPFHST